MSNASWVPRTLCNSLAILSLCQGLGCAGRSVNLDGDPGPAATGGSGNENPIAAQPLNEEMIDFWVDDERIYWAARHGRKSDARVRSCSYGRCRESQVTYGMSSGPIVSSQDDVLFPPIPELDRASPNTWVRCAKSGCVGAPQVIQRDPDSNAAFTPAIDAQFVYWASLFDIYRCAFTGCGDYPELVAAGVDTNGLVQVHDANVYWWEGPPRDSNRAKIFSAPKDGSQPPELLVTAGPYPSTSIHAEPILAVTDHNLYWISDTGQIESCPLAGCGGEEPTVFVSSLSRKQQLRADESNVYWLEGSDQLYLSLPQGTVMFCPLSGCTEGIPGKALTGNSVRKFLLDSKYVYWNEPAVTVSDVYGADKVIFRQAKPGSTP